MNLPTLICDPKYEQKKVKVVKQTKVKQSKMEVKSDEPSVSVNTAAKEVKSKYERLEEEATRKVVLKILVQNKYDGAFDGTVELPSDPIVQNAIRQIKDRKEAKVQRSGKSCDNYFVTINPKPDVSFDELKTCVDKILKKNWIDSYIYSYEQRSEESGKYYGFHVHLMINSYDRGMQNAKKEIYNTVKHIVGNPNHLHISGVTPGTEDMVRDYIHGDKEAGKMQKVQVDKEFRKAFGLQDVYES